MRISPPSIFSRPLMQRSRVDLPEPEGPMRQTTWCSSTCRFTASSTGWSPKCFFTLQSSIRATSLLLCLSAPQAPSISLCEPFNKSCLRDGDDHKEYCNGCHCGEIVMIAGNDHCLVKRIDRADHVHQSRILLQSNETIE